jgi:hypothetical protein
LRFCASRPHLLRDWLFEPVDPQPALSDPVNQPRKVEVSLQKYRVFAYKFVNLGTANYRITVTIASSPKLTRLAKKAVAPAKAGAYHMCLARSTGAIGPSLRWGDELRTNDRENHLIPIIHERRGFSFVRWRFPPAVYCQPSKTWSGGLWPSAHMRMFAITRSPDASRPSKVALPRWGSNTTLGMLNSRESTAGSCV